MRRKRDNANRLEILRDAKVSLQDDDIALYLYIMEKYEELLGIHIRSSRIV